MSTVYIHGQWDKIWTKNGCPMDIDVLFGGRLRDTSAVFLCVVFEVQGAVVFL